MTNTYNPYPCHLPHKKFVHWVQSNGAIVIDVPELSFQQLIVDKLGQRYGLDMNSGDMLQGPLLRLDIPYLIEKHDLFQLPNICPDYILYTDSDVIFVNPITHEDINDLRTTLKNNQDAIVMYVINHKVVLLR